MTMETLTRLIDAYLSELAADGIRDPLGEAFTLAAVLADLYRLAGLPLPLPLAARLVRLGSGPPAAA